MMRRQEREITDFGRINNILEKSMVCRLGLCSEDVPYVVPVNYGFEFLDGKLILYFHSANAGKKIELIKINPKAAFEMDLSYELIEDEVACRHSMIYESVIGVGEIIFCKCNEEKRKALTLLMAHYVPGRAFHFVDEQFQNLCLFKLTVLSYTAKSNKRLFSYTN